MLPTKPGRRRLIAVLTVAAMASLPGAALAASSSDTNSPVPTSWSLTGSGFGHGVGMSQYGARALADQGKSAREILAFYYRGTTYDAVVDNRTIYVNLERAASRVTMSGRARTKGAGSFTVTADGKTIRAAAKQEVTATRRGSGVRFTCPTCSGTQSITATRGEVVLRSGTDLIVSGKRYRYGTLRIAPTTGGSTLEAVLRMRLHDQYLDQIAEVPWSWPTAAMEAQAAAARSYALRRMSAKLRPDCQCHVLDTPADQVFGETPTGITASVHWPKWKAAVRARGTSTTGYVPRYQGQIIQALYSSSHGGYSLNNEDVWGGAPLPYLRSRQDRPSLATGNPMRSWTRTVSGADLARAFGLPDVATLDLSSRVTGTALRTAVATSSSGKKATMSGDRFRSRLGLPSSFVNLAK